MSSLIGELEALYPDESDIRDEVDMLVKELIENGLVFMAEGTHTSKPIFSVHFDLTDEGTDYANTLTELMLTRFNVLREDSTEADLMITDNDDFDRKYHHRQVVIGIGEDCDGADMMILTGAAAERKTSNEDNSFSYTELLNNKPLQQAFFDCFLEYEQIRTPFSEPQAAVTLRKLTIGMATYDDYDGVYFSVQAIRMFHPEIADETEILVIDNNPGGPCAEALKALANSVKGYRYIANGRVSGTAIRDCIFREARTPYVLCIDSHVFVEAGRLRQLIDYFEHQSQAGDLLQGPLLIDDMRSCFSHFEPVWCNGMYGVWGADERAVDPQSEPFDIPMQGLGLFACHRRAWPGINPRFRGFGGEEGYIHQKFRNLGGRTLCLPFLRWLHRFERPMGTRYENRWEHRIRNYLIGFSELGFDTAKVEKHFTDVVNQTSVDKVKAILELEKDNPFDYFDAIYCINPDSQPRRWRQMEKQLEQLGIVFRVRRFSAVEQRGNLHVARALSHRAILEEVRDEGYDNVLVIEDNAQFHEDALKHLARAITELRHREWQVFYLGGSTRDRRYDKLGGCRYLERPVDMTCTHAVAYHGSFYRKLLIDVPADEVIEDWIQIHESIGRYLRCQENRVIMSPVISTPARLTDMEPESPVQ